jgi:predicted nucleotidyltransferase
MEEFIDLGDVADSLSERFRNIKGLYIFGSRAFGTGSPRSDIDILVEYDGHLRPADMRDFISIECKALDLFLVEGGKAISTQNESYVESNNLPDLVSKLNAKKFWDGESGRLQVDIPWKQRVRTDIEFTPSSLPMQPKPKSQNSIDPEKLTIGQLFSALTVKQIVSLISVVVVSLCAAFGAGHWVGTNTVIIKNTEKANDEAGETKPNNSSKRDAASGAPS